MSVSTASGLNRELRAILRRGRSAADCLAVGHFRELWDRGHRRESSRRALLGMLPKRSVGAELGVFKGEFSAQILELVEPRELHLVDMWWEAFGESYPDWGKYTDFGKLSTRDAYNQAVRVATGANHRNAKLVFHVGDDLAYLRSFPDRFFDWVYIDTSHRYDHTAAELALCAVKVRPEGMICGDDWTVEDHRHAGVAQAVTEFLEARGSEFEIKYLRCGQWLIARRASRA